VDEFRSVWFCVVRAHALDNYLHTGIDVMCNPYVGVAVESL
jgi:hypothetical protein